MADQQLDQLDKRWARMVDPQGDRDPATASLDGDEAIRARLRQLINGAWAGFDARVIAFDSDAKTWVRYDKMP